MATPLPENDAPVQDLAHAVKLLEAERKARRSAELELKNLRRLLKSHLAASRTVNQQTFESDAAAARSSLTQILAPAALGVLNRASCGITLHNPETSLIVECNDAGLQMLHAKSARQVVGKHPSELAPPRQPNETHSGEAADFLIRAAASSGAEQLEWMIRRLNGEDFLAQVNLTGVEIDGQPLVMAVWMDISDRARAQQDLQESEARYRRLVEGVQRDYLIFETDLQGVITYISPSAQTVLGYSPEQMIGQTCHRYLVADSPSSKRTEAFVRETLQGIETPPLYVELEHANGETRVLDLVLQTVLNKEGEIIGGSGIGKDVTEEKNIEQELILARDNLEIRVKQRTAELVYRLEFEAILLSLSTGFINLPVDEIQSGLNDALRRIGEFTGVDRAFIYEFGDDHKTISLNYEWCAEGIDSFWEVFRNLPVDRIDPALELAKQGKTLQIVNPHDLPDTMAGFREILTNLGIQSAAYVPLRHEDRLIGYLGTACMNQRREMTEQEISLLEVLSSMLANALERSRAEKALRTSEARFKSVVQDQTDLIVRWKPDGQMTFVNQAVGRFHEEPVEAILGKNVYDYIHPEDREAVRQKINGLTLEAPSAIDEHRVLLSNDRVAWMQWIDRAMFDDSSQVVEIQAVGRDITPLKEANEELQRRLEFEQLILGLSTRLINLSVDDIGDELTEALHQLGEYSEVERTYIYLYDKELTYGDLAYSWTSENYRYQTSKYDRIRLNDFPWGLKLFAQDKPIHFPNLSSIPEEAGAFRQHLETLGVKSYINVPIKSEGKLVGHLGFTSFSHEKTWPDEYIQLLRLLGEIFVNADNRIKTEEALRRSEERLRVTIEGVEEGIFDLNIQTGETYVSDYLMQTLEMPGRDNRRRMEWWSDRIHPDDRQAVMNNLQDHLAGKTDIYDAEYRVKYDSGEYHWAHSRGRVVEHTADGKPLRLVGIQRDITDRMAAQREREELEAKLAHLARVTTMGETVAGIAHEVNQPLHAASTFCAAARSAMQSDKPNAIEKSLELTDKASRQVARAGDIIRQLRDFTRPRPLDYKKTDLNEIIRESTEFVTRIRRLPRVRVDLDLPESPIPMFVDSVQIQQVVVNLLQNALDALQGAELNDPFIAVQSRVEDQRAIVTITDNGSTQPPGNPQELFDAFFTTKPGGMGIGLSLCRTIIEAHGGRISAAPRDGRGMVFSFELSENRSTRL